MPYELHWKMEVGRLEVGARLLGLALLRLPDSGERFFDDPVIVVEGDRRTLVSMREVSPWTYDEFQSLCALVGPLNTRPSQRPLVHGTCVRISPENQLHIGMYVGTEAKREVWRRLAQFQPRTNLPILPVELETLKFAQAAKPGGGSVSNLNGRQTGTLGAWLQEYKIGGFIGISNNHVLCEYGQHSIGSYVIQPGLGDGGTVGDVVGKLAGYVPLMELDRSRVVHTLNRADVAWCEPDEPDGLPYEIEPGGFVPTGEADFLAAVRSHRRKVPVQMCGKSSGHVRGQIVGIRALLLMPGFQGREYAFEDQLEIKFENVGFGDSGSVVLSDPHRSVGALFFSMDPHTRTGFASPWKTVCEEIKKKFVYSTG